ncbi:MAG: hypothetical protein H8E94_04785, partial [Alphaproteobacteria bacterium]|nr:hypothetical protein [Alphaproteobacteria bacterium]
MGSAYLEGDGFCLLAVAATAKPPEFIGRRPLPDISLDIRTMAVLMIPTCGALSIALIFVWKTHRKVEGPLFWAIGMSLYFCGYCLISLRGIIPPVASIVFANTFLVAGVALILRGIRAFQGMRRRDTWEWGSVILVLLSFVYFTHINFDLNARIVIVSAVIALLMSSCSFVLLARVPNGRLPIHLFAASGFAIFAVFLFLRVVLTLMDVETSAANAAFFSPNTVTQMILIVQMLGFILLTLGLAILPGQRTQSELMRENSERERVELALRESEARFKTFMEAVPFGMVAKDANGRFTYVNPV